MLKKIHATPCGDIHYWCSDPVLPDRPSLLFLPGLSADHRLFEKQTAYFSAAYNVFVWDAPAHAASWPFSFSFRLRDKARWLHEIIEREQLKNPILIGQSMGGYVGQVYAAAYPQTLRAFLSIDSAPLPRRYYTAAELWLLRHMETLYRRYPWKALLKSGTKGVATTQYGRQLMRDMMQVYAGDQARYAKLVGHGYRILADAIAEDLPYKLSCPALLICGAKDRAGSCIRYNRAWHKVTGLPLRWIPNAGHNANTDAPNCVNKIIENFIQSLPLSPRADSQAGPMPAQRSEA